MADSGDDFGDDFSDEFEESGGDVPGSGKKGATSYANKPYDEAFELSQDLSMAESFDGREQKTTDRERERKLQNDKYDEALDVSQSMDYKGGSPSPEKRPTGGSSGGAGEAKGTSGGRGGGGSDQMQPIMNRPFDEALEFSQSGSDDSVDTAPGRGDAKAGARAQVADAKGMMPSQSVGGLEHP